MSIQKFTFMAAVLLISVSSAFASEGPCTTTMSGQAVCLQVGSEMNVVWNSRGYDESGTMVIVEVKADNKLAYRNMATGAYGEAYAEQLNIVSVNGQAQAPVAPIAQEGGRSVCNGRFCVRVGSEMNVVWNSRGYDESGTMIVVEIKADNKLAYRNMATGAYGEAYIEQLNILSVRAGHQAPAPIAEEGGRSVCNDRVCVRVGSEMNVVWNSRGYDESGTMRVVEIKADNKLAYRNMATGAYGEAYIEQLNIISVR